MPSATLPLILLLLTTSLLSSCSEGGIPAQAPEEKLLETHVGSIPIHLELAITRQQKSKGLMYRDSLPDDHGMLFIFRSPGQQSFWMKNTTIPLDIAYIDSEGIIREIRKLYPNNQNSVRSYRDDIRFALETNQGWFASNGLEPGAKLDLTPLLPILKANGITL